MDELYDLSNDTVPLKQEKDFNNVELESLGLNDEYADLVMAQIPYPAILIEGITSEEEFLYFRGRPYGENTALPLYCYVDEVITRVGMFDFTMDSLLAVRSIGDYRLMLMKDRETEVEIKINDPVFLSKFIKL